MRGHGNYIELSIHHFAAFFSLSFSYFTNLEDFGVLVLFVSDFADFFFNAARFVRDVKGSRGSDTLFVSLFALVIITWGYTRCYMLPACFNLATWKLNPLSSQYPPISDPKYLELW